jgi:TPR repeat protein
MSADVFAYGMILYQIITGRPPYPDMASVNTAVTRPPPIPDDAPDLVAGIYEACVLRAPSRPQFYHIVQALHEAATPLFPGCGDDFQAYKKRVFPSTLQCFEAEEVFSIPPPKNSGVSLDEIRRRADAGEVDAINQLALRYHRGDGCRRDPLQAYRCAERAASLGSAFGLTQQATWLRDGVPGVAADPARAFGLLQEAAAKGQLDAAFEVGSMLRDGVGVAANAARAAEVWRAAADAGDTPAQYALARLMLKGAPGVQPDLGAARAAYQKAHLANFESASCDYALMLIEQPTTPKDRDEGLRIYRQAATRGNAYAAFNLATIYDGGRYGVPKNLPEAVKYFQIAADKNFVPAIVSYAMCLKTGKGGVPINLSRARELLRKAADSKDGSPLTVAQNNYARMCENGEGGPVDARTALKYYGLAAETIAASGGNTRPIENYLRLYLDGPVDMIRDPNKARQLAEVLVIREAPGAAATLAQVTSYGAAH